MGLLNQTASQEQSETGFSFESYIYHPESQRLFRDGEPVALQPQPCRVLEYLIRNAGSLVSREELRSALWGDKTFVDFDQGLNYCVRQVRRALGDSGRAPHFIETLPRRGYRFLVPVTEREYTAPSAVEHPRVRFAIAVAIVLFGGVAIGHETYPSTLHADLVSWIHGEPFDCGS